MNLWEYLKKVITFKRINIFLYLMSKLSAKVLRQVIKEKVGEDVLELTLLIKKEKDISEFVLSTMLKEDINTIRIKGRAAL